MRVGGSYLSITLIRDLLWRHEQDRTYLVIQGKLLGCFKLSTESKVHDNDRIRSQLFIPNHYVFRLQISMNDIKTMNLCETL